MSRIALTGASGAIGSALLPRLTAAGHSVLALDRHSAPLPETGWFRADDPPELLIHLAGGATARSTLSADEIAAPHLQFLDALLANGFRGGVVFASSAAVYPGGQTPFSELSPTAPLNAYGAAKLRIERGFLDRAKSYGLPLSVLRLANIYGTPQDLRRRRVSGLLIEAAWQGTPFTLYGDGSSQRDYLHIDDLCAAILALLSLAPSDWPAVLTLGSGQGTSLSEMIALVEAATGRPIQRHYAPSQTESAATILDISLAQRRLGWTPRVTLSEGLRRLAASLPI